MESITVQPGTQSILKLNEETSVTVKNQTDKVAQLVFKGMQCDVPTYILTLDDKQVVDQSVAGDPALVEKMGIFYASKTISLYKKGDEIAEKQQLTECLGGIELMMLLQEVSDKEAEGLTEEELLQLAASKIEPLWDEMMAACDAPYLLVEDDGDAIQLATVTPSDELYVLETISQNGEPKNELVYFGEGSE